MQQPERYFPEVDDPAADLRLAIERNVRAAIEEDVGAGDLSARLLASDQGVQAEVISREPAVLCGRPWVDALLVHFPGIKRVNWLCNEGDWISPNQPFLVLVGLARDILTAERILLNFLQLLMGTATQCRRLSAQIAHTSAKLLDTRKTLPGLRLAQKYAASVGGCVNHRFGLFDAVLIKENHIKSCGSIAQAIERARIELRDDQRIELEVENLEDLSQALSLNIPKIMLDNFLLEDIQTAVSRCRAHNLANHTRIRLEASGGITENNLVQIAQTGVDCISIGGLTKDVRAIDLSLRISRIQDL